ncbi:MAG: hypothetical protein K1X91_04795 [Bacteriodetes bacterium]|nr:hypothetical protein [Bacteroidota bacterium]
MTKQWRQILRVAQNDKPKPILCHAEQSEASMEVKILRVAQNDKCKNAEHNPML